MITNKPDNCRCARFAAVGTTCSIDPARKRREPGHRHLLRRLWRDLRVWGEDVSETAGYDRLSQNERHLITRQGYARSDFPKGQSPGLKVPCSRCEKELVQEPAPSAPIPGSMAGPAKPALRIFWSLQV